MQTIKDQVDKLIKDQESASLSTTDDICPDCGEKTSMNLYIPGINRECKLPVACSCQREKFNRMRQVEEVENTNRELEKFRKYSMMDKKFETCTFDTWDHSKTHERYFNLGINYIKNIDEMKSKHQGLLLWGPAGISKSHLSYCIANEAISLNIPTIAISVEGIADKIKSSFNHFEREGETEIFNNLFNASLIILDDFGTEMDNEWNKKIVGKIIDGIWRSKKLLILTTNLTPEQLKQRYSSKEGIDRIYDRIYEMCAFIQMKGKSIRQQIGAEKEKNILKLFEKEEKQTKK